MQKTYICIWNPPSFTCFMQWIGCHRTLKIITTSLWVSATELWNSFIYLSDHILIMRSKQRKHILPLWIWGCKSLLSPNYACPILIRYLILAVHCNQFFYLCNEWMCFKCLYRKPYDMFSRNLFWKIWAIFSPLFQFVGQLVFTICHRLLVFTFLSPLFYKVTKLGEMVAIREWKIFIDFSIHIG